MRHKWLCVDVEGSGAVEDVYNDINALNLSSLGITCFFLGWG